MRFITVRDLRTTPAKIWKDLPEEQEMIITNNGKPIALMTPLDDTNLEETLSAVRQARAVNAVRQMQMHSIKSGAGNMSDGDIAAEIAEYRAGKKS